MRIASVKTHLVHCEIPIDQRVRSGAGLKLARQAAIVEIRTDEGISGFGPASFGSASLDLRAVASMVDNAFAPMLLGEDPSRIQYLWDKIYYGSVVRVHGPRSTGVALLSAVDIALWDLKGKACGLPLFELLGGAIKDPVPAYASSIYWSSPAEAAQTAREFVDRGFRAIKLKVGVDYRADLESLAAVRDEVGPDVDIMVDANQCYSPHLALKVGRELERYDVLFFEEPITTDSVEGHRMLADKLDLRIATGENIYTRWGFVPFITSSAVAVVQADPSRTGGISEARKIFDLASAFHIDAVPHTFSDALTVAAALHLVAASSNAPLIELDQTFNPLQEGIAIDPLVVEDGAIRLPSGPGLGIEIDWDFVAAHPYNGEIGIGLGSRPAFGLASETLADRQATTLR